MLLTYRPCVATRCSGYAAQWRVVSLCFRYHGKTVVDNAHNLCQLRRIDLRKVHKAKRQKQRQNRFV